MDFIISIVKSIATRIYDRVQLLTSNQDAAMDLYNQIYDLMEPIESLTAQDFTHNEISNALQSIRTCIEKCEQHINKLYDLQKRKMAHMLSATIISREFGDLGRELSNCRANLNVAISTKTLMEVNGMRYDIQRMKSLMVKQQQQQQQQSPPHYNPFMYNKIHPNNSTSPVPINEEPPTLAAAPSPLPLPLPPSPLPPAYSESSLHASLSSSLSSNTNTNTNRSKLRVGDFFDCLRDPEVCLWSVCCPCVQYGRTSEILLGDDCCFSALCCVMGSLCCCIPIHYRRHQISEMYGFEHEDYDLCAEFGDLLTDCDCDCTYCGVLFLACTCLCCAFPLCGGWMCAICQDENIGVEQEAPKQITMS